MADTDDALVQRIIEANPDHSRGSTASLFATFVRETAPVIGFFEQRGISCDFFSGHSFGRGWSVGFMPQTDDRSARFVAQKRFDARPNELEVMQRGIIQREASTPTDLLNFARKKFGTPSP